MSSTELNEHGQPVLRWNEPWLIDQQVDELLGWCHGVLCDGELNEQEVAALDFWVQSHPEAQRHWQVRILADRMRKIMVDGVLEAEETKELKDLLHSLVGGEVAMPARTATSMPMDAPPPEVGFEGRRFCLTGKFLVGSRRHCEKQIESRDGICVATVTKDLDYLVVGTLSSRDWIHSAWGRKVESAIALREKYRSPAIISEKHWSGFLV